MRKNLYLVNIILVAEIGLLCLIALVMKTFVPGVILPSFDIPLFVLLSVIPMMIKYYIAPEAEGNLWITVLMAGVTFTVLPLCAHIDMGLSAVKLLVAGTVVFGITNIIYTSIGKRIASGPYGRFAPAANGLMLYLASQCLQGLL